MVESFLLASLIYLEELHVNVMLFMVFIKFGTLENNFYIFPLLIKTYITMLLSDEKS